VSRVARTPARSSTIPKSVRCLTAALLAWGLPGACKATPPEAAEPAAAPLGALVVPSEGLQADLAATEAFLDTRPRYERPLRESGLSGVPGVGALSAEACRACHAEIYDEWRVSVHSQAWLDPQYQAEIAKSGNRWLCLNCHTPLLIQHDRWPRGLLEGDVERPVLTDNPSFDPRLRDEGITCTACHLQDGVIHGPGLPRAEGDPAPPHAVVADPRFQGPDLCLECHQAEAIYEGKTFICTFQTGDEWRAGPYDDEGRTCVTCHMPPIERPAARGGPVRTVRRHWWRGAGIPKSVDRSTPPEANPPGLDLTAVVDDAALQVTMTNANAGHRLPTGDPERWVQVDVQFFAGGTAIGTPWSHRMGQTWEWTAPPRKLADNRLAPRESRVQRVAIPPGATRAVVVAASHRISAEVATHHRLGDYPRSIETHRLEVGL